MQKNRGTVSRNPFKGDCFNGKTRGIASLLVGILASNEDLDGQPRAIVNTMDVIQFRIKILSDVPSYIPTSEFFTCYCTYLPEGDGWEDDSVFDKNYRIEEFIRYADNKLFVFRPYITKDKNGKIQYKVSNSERIIVTELPNKIGLQNRLIPIPISNDYPTFDFERRIIENGQLVS